MLICRRRCVDVVSKNLRPGALASLSATFSPARPDLLFSQVIASSFEINILTGSQVENAVAFTFFERLRAVGSTHEGRRRIASQRAIVLDSKPYGTSSAMIACAAKEFK